MDADTRLFEAKEKAMVLKFTIDHLIDNASAENLYSGIGYGLSHIVQSIIYDIRAAVDGDLYPAELDRYSQQELEKAAQCKKREADEQAEEPETSPES